MTYSKAQELSIELIKRKSITPHDLGCQQLLSNLLQEVGFECHSIQIGETTNLIAHIGQGKPHLMFLGHTDVVSEGNGADWSYDPFSATIVEEDGVNMLYGRGSADMKASDAAMAVALYDFVKSHKNFKGTLSYLITSNEEGDGKGGIKDMCKYLQEHNLVPDYCIVGEPSSAHILGDEIKVGRRGSLSAIIKVIGTQGHVAYPHLVNNPIHLASKLITKLIQDLDQGSQYFPKTSFQVTNIKAGSGTENLVPNTCEFMCNWRFNDLQSPQSIEDKVKGYIQELNLNCELKFILNGLPFLAKDEKLIKIVQDSVYAVTHQTPTLSTSGGTSDGRFIAPLGTHVIECGLVSKTIHKIDEKVCFEDIEKLKHIFEKIIKLTLAKS